MSELFGNQGWRPKLAGSKAARQGFHFERTITRVFNDKQNLERWKGNILASGFQYHIFEKVMDKLGLIPSMVESLHGDANIPSLPIYTYKDGTKKQGGRAKTDVCLTVGFVDGSEKDYTFSCKSTSAKSVTVFQFPPKYCVDILGITEPDTEELLCEYVECGGPTQMSQASAELLTQKLSGYISEFNRWVLHGSDKDGSTPKQRADYIIVRCLHNSEEHIVVETIDECIEKQIEGGTGHFGTAYIWTVTSSKGFSICNRDECLKRDRFPVMRITIHI